MTLIIIVVSLIIIGVLANYCGKLVEYIKLPSLIGMMLLGMFIGPAFLNLVPDVTLAIAPTLKDIALVAVLFIGGLGISLAQMKQIGRPAVLLSAVPATLEGFTIAIIAMLLLNFSFVQGAILGFIIAAVSPAVLIPSMIDLIQRRVGEDKAVPQMLLVGASADDTIAITLFTTFLSIYTQEANNETISILVQLLMIPLTIAISIATGFIIYKLSKPIIERIQSSLGKVIIAFGLCLVMRIIEKQFYLELFNSLLTVMIYGFFIRNYIVSSSQVILDQMNTI